MQKNLNGRVVSAKMNKTAVVQVVRRFPHPLYKKIISRFKKYKVDIGNFSVSVGDEVVIVETKPISKNKHFKVTKILSPKEEKK